MKSEFELIEILRKKIPRRMQGRFGIGDDAAVLPGLGRERWLLTTDVIVEGVDFRRLSPEMVGRKALAVNLSDIAAMGGRPVAFVVSLGIPKKLTQKWIERFYQGLIRLAEKYKVLCVGGDMSRANQFFASIAMLGRAGIKEVITRNGARPGDLIVVTGRLGGSMLGHHYLFEPRVKEARFLAQRIHPTAMIDLSDGLLQDLGHILAESKVGASLHVDKIPVSRDAQKLSRGNSQKAVERALTDGEDFELLFTYPPEKKEILERLWRRQFPGIALTRIGTIRKEKGRINWYQNEKEVKAPLVKKTGFSHF